MTLQEQIARRLSGIGPEWDDIKGLEFTEAVMRRAAEIERWMEWARRSHALPDYIAAGPGKWPPLTLPPDGWKP